MHPCRSGRQALSSRGAMNVFDREAKRRQKNRAAASSDAETYDYLRNEVRDEDTPPNCMHAECDTTSFCVPPQVASHIMDRVSDVAKFFPLALDMGCGRSHIAMATTGDVTGCLVQCDMAEHALVCGGGVLTLHTYNFPSLFLPLLSLPSLHFQSKDPLHQVQVFLYSV